MTQIPDDLSRAIHHTTISIPPIPMQLSDSTSPEEQLARAMINANIDISNPPDIVFDGKMHRFSVDTDKRGKKSGWYVAFGGDIPAWNFGNWKFHSDGEGINGHITVNREWTDIERENYRKQQELIKQKKAAEREKRAKLASTARSQALEIWNAAIPATNAHEYIAKKKIQAHNLRVITTKIKRLDGGKELNLKDALIIPYSDSKGITTLQFITPTGDKFFLPCGSLDNARYLFKGMNDPKRVYVVEGWATGASVHEATGNDVIVAINTGGLKRLAPSIRASYDATTKIVFVADNDDPAKGATQGAGEIAAREAAVTIGAKVILIPRINGDKADANDYAAFYGVDKLRELLTPSEQTSVSNNPAAMAGDYSGFAFNMDGKGSVTPISSPLPAIGASSAAMPTEIPVTQNILAASPAMPQTPITTLPTQASATDTNTVPIRHSGTILDTLTLEQQEKIIKETVLKASGLLDTSEPTPDAEYIANLFPRGFYNLLAAAPGIGKTFLLERIAVDLSNGGDILNGFSHTEKPLTTLIVVGETGKGLLIRRAKMMKWKLNPKYIPVFEASQTTSVLGGVYLDKPQGKLVLKILLEEYKPDIVFIDSLTSFFSGSFNKQEEVTPIITTCSQFAKDYNCAIVLVHHIRKRMVSERETPLDLDDIVGTGALARNCAVAIGIERDVFNRDVKVVKILKDWERKSPNPFTFEIREDLYHNKEMHIDLEPLEEIVNPILTKTGRIDKRAAETTGLLEELQSVLDVTKPFLKKEIKEKLKTAGYNYSDAGLVRKFDKLIKLKSIFFKGTQRYAVYFFTDYYEGPDFNKEMCKALHDGRPLEEVYKIADDTPTKEVAGNDKEGSLTLDIK